VWRSDDVPWLDEVGLGQVIDSWVYLGPFGIGNGVGMKVSRSIL
jgi:hypothetical protein